MYLSYAPQMAAQEVFKQDYVFLISNIVDWKRMTASCGCGFDAR